MHRRPRSVVESKDLAGVYNYVTPIQETQCKTAASQNKRIGRLQSNILNQVIVSLPSLPSCDSEGLLLPRWDTNWDGRDPKSMVKPPREFHAGDGEKMSEWSDKVADILFLKHACNILRQSSNPVCGSRKSQASSPWAKQHRA